jgi:biotin transport system substrate-specific component
MSKHHTAPLNAAPLALESSLESSSPALSLPPRLAVWLRPPWVRAMAIVLSGTVLAAICARVSVPLYFTPVPLSLAPFAVLLLGLLLTPRMAAATFAAYLAEGALGLPVFAPSPLNGVAHLLGPTGGYLLAYPLAAMLISWLFRLTGRGFTAALLSATAGDLAILTSGALWLAALPHFTARPTMAVAVLPFLPGDALKIAAAAALAVGFSRLRRSASLSHLK